MRPTLMPVLFNARFSCWSRANCPGPSIYCSGNMLHDFVTNFECLVPASPLARFYGPPIMIDGPHRDRLKGTSGFLPWRPFGLLISMQFPCRRCKSLIGNEAIGDRKSVV